MDVARPYKVLSPSLDSDVLNVLAGTSRPLTGREVSRLVGRMSHSGVREVLNRLSLHGLVHRQEAGRALLFTLNREHLAAPAVTILAGMQAELLRRLRQRIENWNVAPVHASIFGSAARGDGNVRSDIDLFIVRPKDIDDHNPAWREQIDDLAIRVRDWTGNHAAITEVAEMEILRLREEEPPIIAEMGNDAVLLFGPSVSAMFRQPP
ncbi:MAG: hypothetical protein NVSMB52_18200 [Chloroflexota bacterium]